MTVGNDRWTKWWWLRIDQIAHWSDDERQASTTFFLTWAVTAALSALWGWGVLFLLKVLSPDARLPFSFLVALSGSLLGSRALTTLLFPDTVIDGDDAAAARMGGRVYLPADEPSVGWFFDRSSGRTKTQRDAQRRMAVIFVPILLVTFLPSVYLLMNLGMSEGLALLIVLLTILPADLYATRRIAAWWWPDLVRQADKDTITRENEINPPRT